MLIDIAHYSVFSLAKSQQLGECCLCIGMRSGVVQAKSTKRFVPPLLTKQNF